jgi:hypothetical protein
LVRLALRRLMALAGADFANGREDHGQLSADAAFRIAERTGVGVGG